ncbi:MAG TPA: trimeric intracellular cation channel family protein [Xanthomonadaceae bacterium]|nr:trimeric intracellular cation channel family protein [Xanthomonadaceae bacterium]
MDSFLFALDLIGTFVFALSGATLGVRYKLDLFGVLVMAVAASTAGGIVRDVLIGAVPPAAIGDWRYFGVALAAGLLAFFRDGAMARLRNPVMLFDAVGLGLCAATGANKALDHGLGAGFAVFLGMLSGIGGGIARDVLVARIPVVLRSEFYAVAALFGAALVVAGIRLGLPREPVMIAGASLCFVLRFVAIRRGWRLPVAQQAESTTQGQRSNSEDIDPSAR